jgi:hypothetical protein
MSTQPMRPFLFVSIKSYNTGSVYWIDYYFVTVVLCQNTVNSTFPMSVVTDHTRSIYVCHQNQEKLQFIPSLCLSINQLTKCVSSKALLHSFSLSLTNVLQQSHQIRSEVSISPQFGGGKTINTAYANNEPVKLAENTQIGSISIAAHISPIINWKPPSLPVHCEPHPLTDLLSRDDCTKIQLFCQQKRDSMLLYVS